MDTESPILHFQVESATRIGSGDADRWTRHATTSMLRGLPARIGSGDADRWTRCRWHGGKNVAESLASGQGMLIDGHA